MEKQSQTRGNDVQREKGMGERRLVATPNERKLKPAEKRVPSPWMASLFQPHVPGFNSIKSRPHWRASTKPQLLLAGMRAFN